MSTERVVSGPGGREATHAESSSSAIAAVLETSRPRRVAVMRCGDGETMPLDRLLRIADLIDFVDVDDEAVALLRERVEALAADGVEVRYHIAELTGCVDEARAWSNEVAFAADTPADCMPELGRRLVDLLPRFWDMPEMGTYDLVICANVITQLPTSVLSVIDGALRDRFGNQADDPGVRDALNRAAWTFTRGLEGRLIGYLDTVVAPGGIVYLSGSVHVHSVTSDDRSLGSVGGAWRMTATPHLRDYLRPWHTLGHETSWNWWYEDSAPGRWGRLYRIQAVTYRTPVATHPVAEAPMAGALPGLRLPKPSVPRPDAAGATPATPPGRATPWLSRTVRLFGHEFVAFTFFPVIGFILASALTIVLTQYAGWNPWVQAIVLGLAPPTVLAAASLRKLRTGEVRTTFYRYAALYFVVAAVALRLLGRPVMPYLDLLALGLVAWQVLARFGCLMAGCCHGRPGWVGVRYGTAYVNGGFPAHLAGVRLLPVPLIESGVCVLATAAGVWTVLSEAPVGATAAMCLGIYAIGRFVVEELRGDVNRPHALRISEAQWTSLAILVGIAAVELVGWIPIVSLHLWLAGVGAAGATTLIVLRARTPQLLEPRRLRDLALALDSLRSNPDDSDEPTPRIVEARGMNVSLQPVEAGSGSQWLVTVSRPRAWGRVAARRVSATVRELTRSARTERLPGRPELLHLLLTPAGASPPAAEVPRGV